MTQTWSNILLVAGSGQNSGKTTFICQLLGQLSSFKPIAIKVSPHFHAPTSGLKVLAEEPNFQLFEETDRTSRKDSSRYLQYGANRSFYLQVNDSHLQTAFVALLPYLEACQPILIESAAMHHIVSSGLLAFITRENDEQKPSAEISKKVADVLFTFNGQEFTPTTEHLIFDTEWKIMST
ncbi:hypothetical protein [Mangrovibacterium sp.]|uniref:hypothetical protein n=1 Tax=Mangrovibacterium sp. TaxID=1961364 RepID=UPI003562E9F5